MYIYNSEDSACVNTDPLSVVKTLYKEWIKQEFKSLGNIKQTKGGTFIFESEDKTQSIELTDFQIRVNYSFDDILTSFGNSVEVVYKSDEYI